MTRGELHHASSSLAVWPLDSGLKPCCRVAIHRCNSIEIVTLYLACFKAGLIAVPINIRLKAPEVAWILRHSEPSLPALGDGLSHLPPRDANEACAIFYTSGTTARPKGVTHSHASLAGTAQLVDTMLPAAGATTLSLTQVSHMSAMALLLPSLISSHTSVLLPMFDAGAVLNLIERHRVHFALGMPALLAMMADEQTRRPRDVSSLRSCLVGGDAAPLALHQTYRDFSPYRSSRPSG